MVKKGGVDARRSGELRGKMMRRLVVEMMLSYRGYSVLKGLVHTIAEVKSANPFCLSYIFGFLSRTCLFTIGSYPSGANPLCIKTGKKLKLNSFTGSGTTHDLTHYVRKR